MGAIFAIAVVFAAVLLTPPAEEGAARLPPPPPAAADDSFEQLRVRGNDAMDANRCEEAIAAYESALAIRFDADTATDRGVCMRQLGRRDEALAAFEFVTLKEPSHWEARYNFTAMLLELGRIDEARASFEIVKRQRPGDEPVRILERALANVR